jgi:multiple sugar transport system permease protein
LARPGLAATAIFCLITSWNEFLLALILTADRTVADAYRSALPAGDAVPTPIGARSAPPAFSPCIPIMIFRLHRAETFWFAACPSAR